MNKRNLLLSSALTAFLTALVIAFEVAVADFMGGELTIVGLCLSPFWLIVSGAAGALLYRRLAGASTAKVGAGVGALGGLLGVLLPFLALILSFFLTSDLQTAVSGTTFFAYVGAFLFWIPLMWIACGALGGLLPALILRRRKAAPQPQPEPPAAL